MMRGVAILTFASLLLAGGVLADTDCAVPMTQWQPREAVAQLAQKNGWTVRRIKIDDGCYEVVGTDATGAKLKVKIDPRSLEIMSDSHADDSHHRHGKKSDRKAKDSDDCRETDAPCLGGPENGPTGSGTPPDNGLFGDGNAPRVKSN